MQTPDDTSRPDIPCVILAGGQSRRFGSNKALVRVRGARLSDLMIQRLAAQTTGPIAVNAPDDGPLSLAPYPILPDLIHEDIGPLAGLHAALSWAESLGQETVITSPVDTPNLPDDYVEQLLAATSPAVATCKGRIHALHGIWPVSLKPDLEAHISTGTRAARHWASACGAQNCEYAPLSSRDPFFYVNTQDDLSRLLAS